MNRVAIAAVAIVGVVAMASCDSTESQRAVTSGAVTSAQVTPQATEGVVADSIPTVNESPDRGCLDEAGTLRARVSDWYPDAAGSPLELNGERAKSTALDAFGTAASDAVTAVAPEFALDDQSEYRRTQEGCATHRYAVFVNGEDKVVVSAWRVESAAASWWVPNEAEFEALDNETLVSRGEHIEVVLAVAADGTTSRVSAYGARAAELVAGWPSTVAPALSAPPPGPSPLGVDQLVFIADAMLVQVLDHR
jgi:hypothetical protein